MAVELDESRRDHLIKKLRGFFLEEFDEDLSSFRAEGILDFFVESMGPSIYNQGVEDARVYMGKKLEDLDAEIHEPETA
ncbi:MAG: DUF2164 domain-containing protein [Gemmatimonadota bacterium]|jgi:uncharacterized protein (DUF2164 family)